MKKMNKKGFTIVELVIVIAVIAILAGVMIPTFTGLVQKAKESELSQTASAAYREAYALAIADDGEITAGETAEAAGFEFTFNAGGLSTTAVDAPTDFDDYDVSVVDGAVVLTPIHN